MSMSNITHVILSGGTGSRLWPLSRKSCPKQYLEIFEGKSLFQLCLERNKFLQGNRIVVGSEGNYKLSRSIFEKSGIDDFLEIIESVPKNTAPAIAFAALSSHPEDILLVTPSDQLVLDELAYRLAVQKAISHAERDFLVTFGITPTAPETGYGYIQVEDGLVKRFKEKPSLESARTYLQMGDHFWNSGMFCFKAGVFLKELEFFQPEVFEQVVHAFNQADSGFIPKSVNEQIKSISVDYAVMEHSKKLIMVEGDFKWSDLGSFESLSDYLKQRNEIHEDEHGNVYIGKSRHASFLGVNNMIFVETPDAFLILNKAECQNVKSLFELYEVENPSLVN